MDLKGGVQMVKGGVLQNIPFFLYDVYTFAITETWMRNVIRSTCLQENFFSFPVQIEYC